MPKPASFASPEQLTYFVDWLEKARTAKGVSKSRLAAELGHGSIQHVNKILSGKVIPMPATIRVLCRVLDLSWPEAYSLAGYIEEIFFCLASLAQLSDAWRREDNTRPPIEERSLFRSNGVLSIDGAPILGALRADARLASRYIFGFWEEDNSKVEFVGETPPPEVIAFMNRDRLHGAVCIPKPLAVAIVIVGAGFARRGDVWKDEYHTYAAEVLRDSAPLFELAESKRPKVLPPLLRLAYESLNDKRIGEGQRRLIAAEYVNAWIDSLSANYTHIVRLAAYCVWGEAGSRESTVTAFVQLPRIRIAQMPTLESLQLDATDWTAGAFIPGYTESTATNE
jgi:transcriptional regulator with XRE-family HTH domain